PRAGHICPRASGPWNQPRQKAAVEVPARGRQHETVGRLLVEQQSIPRLPLPPQMIEDRLDGLAILSAAQKGRTIQLPVLADEAEQAPRAPPIERRANAQRRYRSHPLAFARDCDVRAAVCAEVAPPDPLHAVGLQWRPIRRLIQQLVPMLLELRPADETLDDLHMKRRFRLELVGRCPDHFEPHDEDLVRWAGKLEATAAGITIAEPLERLPARLPAVPRIARAEAHHRKTVIRRDPRPRFLQQPHGVPSVLPTYGEIGNVHALLRLEVVRCRDAEIIEESATVRLVVDEEHADEIVAVEEPKA